MMKTKKVLSRTTKYEKTITMAEVRKKFSVPAVAEVSIVLDFEDYDNRGGKRMLTDTDQLVAKWEEVR